MQRKNLQQWVCAAAIMLGLLITGCSSGPTLQPVKGIVKVDGKPTKGVTLVFILEGAGMNNIPASAVSGEDGSFTLVTGESGGAEVGKYKVNATYPDPNAKAAKQFSTDPIDPPDLFKGKYAAGKSTMSVEVKPGVADLGALEFSL